MSDIDDLNSFMSSNPMPSAPVVHPAPPGNDLDDLNKFMAGTKELRDKQYGGPLGTIEAGLESAANTATLGLPDVLNNITRKGISALGGNPDSTFMGLGFPSSESTKDLRAANPTSDIVGGGLGAIPLAALTGGVGAGLAGTETAAGLSGALSEATGLGTIGSHVAATGAEGALMGVGNVISDAALGDPDLSAQKIASQIGLSTLFGMGGGLLGGGISKLVGKFGAPAGSLAETVAKEADTASNETSTQTAMENVVANSEDDSGVPGNDQKVIDIAREEKLPDPTEGMITNDEDGKRLEFALSKSYPTIAGLLQRTKLKAAFSGVMDAVTDMLPDDYMSPNRLGTALKNLLSSRISGWAEPIDQMYDSIREITPDVMLNESSGPSIARNILSLTDDPLFGSKSPASALARDVAEEVPKLKTVEDLRRYQQGLNNRVAGANLSGNDKFMISRIQDKLDQWERRAISDGADKFFNDIDQRTDMTPKEKNDIWGEKVAKLKDLQGQIDAADAHFAPIRQKVSALSEWLGKDKISGFREAINFINDRLEPEDIAQRMANPKYASKFDFMKNNFPQEYQMIREYMKTQLKESATASGEFNLNTFFKKFGSMEPETQNVLFDPDEIKRLGNLEYYLRRMPKNFQPSGTATESWLRHALSHPTAALAENATDAATLAKLKALVALPKSQRPNVWAIADDVGKNYAHLNAANRITARADMGIANGVQHVLTGAGAANLNIPSGGSYKEKTDRIAQLATNPDVIAAHTNSGVDGVSQTLPNISQKISGNIANAAQFLNSQIPKPAGTFPLSEDWEPSRSQIDKFENTFNTVNNPLGVFKDIRSGELNMDQLHALAAVHPALYKEMQDKLTAASTDVAKKMPNYLKNSVAMFLGKPLTENTYQPVMANNQMVFSQAQAQKASIDNPKPSKAGISKIKTSKRAATATQSLEEADV